MNPKTEKEEETTPLFFQRCIRKGSSGTHIVTIPKALIEAETVKLGKIYRFAIVQEVKKDGTKNHRDN